MKGKWIAVLAFWAAFFTYMVLGLRSGNKWFEVAPVLAIDAVLLFLSALVLVRCVRARSVRPFWEGAYPRWFRRFAQDQRIDPLL